MEVGWYFYRFDHARFLEIRTSVQRADIPSDFTSLIPEVDTEGIGDLLRDGALTPAEARNAVVQTVCCVGEALNINEGLPQLVSTLRKWPGGEDASEQLGELLAGRCNVDPWMLSSSGLAGFFTPQQNLEFAQSYAAIKPPAAFSAALMVGRRNRARRGGLIPAMRKFLHTLLDRGPRIEESLVQLGLLSDEAMTRHEGIAVVIA